LIIVIIIGPFLVSLRVVYVQTQSRVFEEVKLLARDSISTLMQSFVDTQMTKITLFRTFHQR